MKTIAAFLFAVPVWLVLQVHALLIYVNEAASGSHDGSSWATAYTYLQDALEAAEAVTKSGCPQEPTDPTRVRLSP